MIRNPNSYDFLAAHHQIISYLEVILYPEKCSSIFHDSSCILHITLFKSLLFLLFSHRLLWIPKLLQLGFAFFFFIDVFIICSEFIIHWSRKSKRSSLQCISPLYFISFARLFLYLKFYSINSHEKHQLNFECVFILANQSSFDPLEVINWCQLEDKIENCIKQWIEPSPKSSSGKIY